MQDLNKVMLIGRLGGEPKKRIPTPDFSVTNFSIATSESWIDKNTGERQEKTEWHRIVTFNKLAEICSEYLHKGKKIYIEGKLQTRSYDKDGQTRYITEVVASDMKMLDPKDKSEGPPASKQEDDSKE